MVQLIARAFEHACACARTYVYARVCVRMHACTEQATVYKISVYAIVASSLPVRRITSQIRRIGMEHWNAYSKYDGKYPSAQGCSEADESLNIAKILVPHTMDMMARRQSRNHQ